MSKYYIKISKKDYYTWKIGAIILFICLLVVLEFNRGNKTEIKENEATMFKVDNQSFAVTNGYLDNCVKPLNLWLSNINNSICDAKNKPDCDRKEFEYAKLYQQEIICEESLK